MLVPSRIRLPVTGNYALRGKIYASQNDTTRCGNFTAAGCRYAVEIGLRRSLYVNGLCAGSPAGAVVATAGAENLQTSGVRQVFRAERPKPQPPHVYYYYHQNFAYIWIALLSRVNQE